jgi:hypothetical protein
MTYYETISFNTNLHSFETRPGGSTRDPADPELEPGGVNEKIGKVMTRQNPVAIH